MRRLSQETKEIIYIVVAVVVVAILVTIYVAYPLSVVKSTFAREDIDSFNPDSLQAIDLTGWTHIGLAPETLRVQTDGTTGIACYYVRNLLPDSTKGTVIVLHDENENADSFALFCLQLAEQGFHAIVCDMRGTRFSGGKYRSDGQLEATDCEEMVSNLFVKGDIVEPLVVVGFDIGATAALMAASDEPRIGHVYAVNPALSTEDLIDRYRLQNDNYWFPGYKSTIWWWWEMRSGYSSPAIEAESFPVPKCASTVFLQGDKVDDELLSAYQSRAMKPMTIERATDKETVKSAILLMLKHFGNQNH